MKRLLQRIERKLDEPGAKATWADFIRLLQMHQELREEQPREVTVRWVEKGED